KMFQEAVMVPIGEWSKKRLSKLSENDLTRLNSASKSGFGKKVANWLEREMVYPTNVLHLPTECTFKGHSAVFPVELPQWFIKLFTQPGDTVLDPFVGSGTTCVASLKLGRNCIGIDIKGEYIELAEERIKKEVGTLFSIQVIKEAQEVKGEACLR
ncbi:MAG: site-specific DNA-methyltransferase, partial [Aquificaceae bacterium]|nr:site-specific DNA-methyltransferase [Aquificaceae bacterium]